MESRKSAPLLADALEGVRLRIEDNIKTLCNYDMSQSLALVLVHIIIFSTKPGNCCSR